MRFIKKDFYFALFNLKFILNFALYSVIIIYFSLILYFHRVEFIEKYDIEYWKDRYEHSQWILPLSQRSIGDDAIYAYVGYLLAKGEDPSLQNVDTPPVGKYLIGYSILLFNNPFLPSLLMGTGSLILLFLIARKLLGDDLKALIVITLFFLDRLFFSQLWISMLDVPQLFFLLLNIVLIIYSYHSKPKRNFFFVSMSGLFLGLCMMTKTPLLAFFILFFEGVYLLYKKTKSEFVLFLIGVGFGLVIPYSIFFIKGHSFIDFLKLQKYIVVLRAASKVQVNIGSVWEVLLFGKFANIGTTIKTFVAEWSFIWVLLIISLFIATIKTLIGWQRKDIWTVIILFLILSLGIYTVIPFYTRYLLLILPFFYLVLVYVVGMIPSARTRFIVFSGILSYACIQAFTFLFPNPATVISSFYYNYSHFFFQDIYQENLALSQRPTIDRNTFWIKTQGLLEDASIQAIDIKELHREETSNKITINTEVTYKTQNLGNFKEQKEINLIQENSQWKVIWNWNLLLNRYKPEYIVNTKLTPGKRGRILDEKKGVLAEDSEGYLIFLNPELIDKKNEWSTLLFLQNISSKSAINLQNAYLENRLPHAYKALASTFRSLNTEDIILLNSTKGIKIQPYISRLYYNLDPTSIRNINYDELSTRIYSSYNYHGVSGLEKQYDSILSAHDGGEVVIKDKNGQIIRTVISKEAKNGNDVYVRL